MTNDLGFVVLSAKKDPQHSNTNLTFRTPILFVLRWFWILHFVQDYKEFPLRLSATKDLHHSNADLTFSKSILFVLR